MDVQHRNGKSDSAGEVLGTLCPHAVETPMLEIVDRRFNRRMLAFQVSVLIYFFAFCILGGMQVDFGG